MSEITQPQASAPDDDDARLASLGYQPQLRRVLGLFANFSVAFTYLSPMVGIYSLFVLGVATGTDVSTADVIPLVSAGVFAGLTAWWGPGGASLRRGSRSIVRGISPGETMRQVVAAVLLVVAAGILAVTVTGDGPSWWPRSEAPSWVDTTVPFP